MHTARHALAVRTLVQEDEVEVVVRECELSDKESLILLVGFSRSGS